jgi:hypothetical protein
MELTTLLNRTKVSVSNLTIYEHRLLSFLLARVNKDKLTSHGYLAWPATQEIIDYTGISKTKIEEMRKTLRTSGWLNYTSGHGKGSSNHYYINASKIVACYIASGNKEPEGLLYQTNIEQKPTNKQHKRNTSGLRQGTATPVSSEQPKKETTRQDAPKPVESNPDGSPMWFEGVRVYNQKEYDEAGCPF